METVTLYNISPEIGDYAPCTPQDVIDLYRDAGWGDVELTRSWDSGIYDTDDPALYEVWRIDGENVLVEAERITIKEAAARKGISVNSIRNARVAGKLTIVILNPDDDSHRHSLRVVVDEKFAAYQPRQYGRG